jgi:hypothetical protein
MVLRWKFNSAPASLKQEADHFASLVNKNLQAAFIMPRLLSIVFTASTGAAVW